MPPTCLTRASITSDSFRNIINCAAVPGMTVASAADGNIGQIEWTGCKDNFIPGSTCEVGLSNCGTISTYWGANCQEATACGQVNMQACLGGNGIECNGP